MQVVTRWRRLDDGCLEALEEWAQWVDEPRLIIIDTVPKIRPIVEARDRYTADYRTGEQLAEFAGKYSGLAMIGNIHTRKLEAEDPFDTINSTLGLSGGADTIGVLMGKASGAALHIVGRDVERSESAIEFNKNTCRWTILDRDAVDLRQRNDRSRILAALKDAPDGMAAREIIVAAELTGSTTKVEVVAVSNVQRRLDRTHQVWALWSAWHKGENKA
jgi:hypothetical protein